LYQIHFKFHSTPFAVSPDSTFLYESQQHAAALTMLEYALESQAPFCLLTGEIGSGKTTLIHRLLRMVRDQPVTVGLVSHSHDRFRSIHPWALSALGIVCEEESEIGQFEVLNDFFIREHARGRRTVLIFDEAQNLSVRTLEELRLLSNVNAEKVMALQIILVGQPELRSKLELRELRQFAQRVSIDFHLSGLTLPEADAYVRHRLRVAGGSEAIFDSKSIELIHERTHGIPRLINQLCNLCLVYAYAAGSQEVTPALVAEVLRDKSQGYKTRLAASGAAASTSSANAPADAAAKASTVVSAVATATNGANTAARAAAAPPMAKAPPVASAGVPATNGANAAARAAAAPSMAKAPPVASAGVPATNGANAAPRAAAAPSMAKASPVVSAGVPATNGANAPARAAAAPSPMVTPGAIAKASPAVPATNGASVPARAAAALPPMPAPPATSKPSPAAPSVNAASTQARAAGVPTPASSAKAAPAASAAAFPNNGTGVPARVAVAPLPVITQTAIDEVLSGAGETQATAVRPKRANRLALLIGMEQPNIGVRPLRIPVQPEIGGPLPLKVSESAQLKKGRSKAHRSWFFFS
jgi:type II secretory pathway predicted ATPase ExeA